MRILTLLFGKSRGMTQPRKLYTFNLCYIGHYVYKRAWSLLTITLHALPLDRPSSSVMGYEPPPTLHRLHLVRWPELDEGLVKNIHVLCERFGGNDVGMLVRAWQFNCKPAWGQCHISQVSQDIMCNRLCHFPVMRSAVGFSCQKERGFLHKGRCIGSTGAYLTDTTFWALWRMRCTPKCRCLRCPVWKRHMHYMTQTLWSP